MDSENAIHLSFRNREGLDEAFQDKRPGENVEITVQMQVVSIDEDGVSGIVEEAVPKGFKLDKSKPKADDGDIPPALFVIAREGSGK